MLALEQLLLSRTREAFGLLTPHWHRAAVIVQTAVEIFRRCCPCAALTAELLSSMIRQGHGKVLLKAEVLNIICAHQTATESGVKRDCYA